MRSSRSDPTVRGFSGEKALEAQRNRLKGVASSSPWREEQDKEYKFSKLEVLVCDRISWCFFTVRLVWSRGRSQFNSQIDSNSVF